MRHVFCVRSDGLDHQVELIGAVDLPGYAVVLAWRKDAGFSEVVQPIDPARRVISHDEHGTGAVFHPREQEQMIGAEIEHEAGQREGRAEAVASARCQHR